MINIFFLLKCKMWRSEKILKEMKYRASSRTWPVFALLSEEQRIETVQKMYIDGTLWIQ